MSDLAQSSMPVAFSPPRAGMWELETTHHGLRPLSPLLREAYRRAFQDGTRQLVEAYGLPLEGVDAELVHGCFYVRPRGLGEGDKPSPTPPKIVMKVVDATPPGAAPAQPGRRRGVAHEAVAAGGRPVVRP